MATLIDWSQVDLKVNGYRKRFGYDTRSLALTHVVLEANFNLTDDEIQECITEGSQDRGIDAVAIEDRDPFAVVHLFQVKCVDSFEKAGNNFPSSEIDKLLSFIQDLLRKDPKLQHTCNPILWGKVQEIWDLFGATTPRFVVHLAGNLAPLVASEAGRLESALEPYRYFTTRQHTLASLARLLVEVEAPRIDRKLQVVDDQYFERVDGNIRGMVATVQAKELVRLIADPEDPSRPLQEIFQENARVYLTQKNRINRKILDSALAESNAEFWYLNNGITITCEHLEYQPRTRAPILDLTNVQVVNGGQTSNALFEAFQQNSERVGNALVLVRIYETKRREISAKIAESTNSQTPIRSRDLRSNDEIQKKLELSFRELGYAYERKAGQFPSEPAESRIDALLAGQAYVAYQLHLPEIAGKDRGKVFGELYEQVFSPEISAGQLLVPLLVLRSIDKDKRQLERAIRRGEDYDPALLYLIDGAYHQLFAVSHLCAVRGIDHWDLETTMTQVPDSRTLVQAAVKREITDPAFAYKRFFKSTRSRRYIEEAARNL